MELSELISHYGEDLMNRNLFKKNPNQSLYRKNMVSKHTDMLDVLLIESSKHQGVNINMT